jgi:hypothetical protein
MKVTPVAAIEVPLGLNVMIEVEAQGRITD